MTIKNCVGIWAVRPLPGLVTVKRLPAPNSAILPCSTVLEARSGPYISPLKMDDVPSVTMSEGKLNRAIMAPFTAPHTAPMSMAKRNTVKMEPW